MSSVVPWWWWTAEALFAAGVFVAIARRHDRVMPLLASLGCGLMAWLMRHVGFAAVWPLMRLYLWATTKAA